MLQEIRETLTDAATLVAKIGLRFKAGDAADELVTQLKAKLATLTRLTSDTGASLPDDVKAEFTQLLSLVETTISTGEEWLARTGPELAAQHLRLRLRRVYRIP